MGALVVAVLLALGAIIAMAIALAHDAKEERDLVNRLGRTPGYWYEITPRGAKPPERLAHAATTVGEVDLYIHGGFYGFGNASLNDLWRYHEPTDSWEELATTGDVPSARLHHSLVSVNNAKLLLFGGFNVFNLAPGHASLDDLYELNLRTLVWTHINGTTGAVPTSRGAHDAVYLNGYMWVFGGFPSIAATGHHEEMWRYSPTSQTWTSMTMTTPWPEGRIGFSFTSLGSELLLYGGGCESQGQCNDTWAYDTSSNTWVDHQPAGTVPPPRRATHGDVAVFGILYLFGGVSISVVGGAPAVTMLDDLWAYDVVANKWFRLHPDYDRGARPPATFGHSVSRLGSSVVVFGGRVGAPTSPGSNQLWEYEVLPPRN